MKSRHWKLVVYMIVVGVMVCAVTYADKDEGVTLPDAAAAAVGKLFPAAEIEEVELDEEGVKVYEVELAANGKDVGEVTVAPDGTVVELEAEISADALPQTVKDAVGKVAEGAEIKEAGKEVTYWIVKLVKLPEPRVSYDVELVKDGKEYEIEVAADGTILEELECKKQDDDDDDDEDDDDEEQVSIDDVPAAVKATILANAGDGTVKEIERETEDGKAVYEAEVIIDGQEVEIKVADDGTLLSKEVDDDDDDDDDDDEQKGI